MSVSPRSRVSGPVDAAITASQDCDIVATALRHPRHTLEDMNKAIATTVLAAALAITLSGCTFGLGEPDEKPEAKPQATAEAQPEATDDDEAETSSAATAECTDGEPVTIDVDDVTVEFTGVCGDVSITGDHVTADFEEVGNVSVVGEHASVGFTGSTLDVTVAGANNMLFGNAMESINVGGTFNSVSATVATAIAVSGSDNSISWASGPADGTDTGTGNAFTGPSD